MKNPNPFILKDCSCGATFPTIDPRQKLCPECREPNNTYCGPAAQRDDQVDALAYVANRLQEQRQRRLSRIVLRSSAVLLALMTAVSIWATFNAPSGLFFLVVAWVFGPLAVGCYIAARNVND